MLLKNVTIVSGIELAIATVLQYMCSKLYPFPPTHYHMSIATACRLHRDGHVVDIPPLSAGYYSKLSSVTCIIMYSVFLCPVCLSV